MPYPVHDYKFKTNLGLSSPWMIYFKEIETLFKDDPEVHISFNDDDYTITLRVDNEEKASALEKLLPLERTFGNVTVKIQVIPANGFTTTKAILFEQAFDGNPNFVCLQTASKGIFTDLAYVVFKRRVAQFFADELNDLNGNRSMLYQDIAADVFGDISDVFFCTDTDE